MGLKRQNENEDIWDEQRNRHGPVLWQPVSVFVRTSALMEILLFYLEDIPYSHLQAVVQRSAADIHARHGQCRPTRHGCHDLLFGHIETGRRSSTLDNFCAATRFWADICFCFQSWHRRRSRISAAKSEGECRPNWPSSVRDRNDKSDRRDCCDNGRVNFCLSCGGCTRDDMRVSQSLGGD